MFSELDCKVLRAFLVDGNSYRDIERKILGLDAPVRGGGYAAMNIVHKYGITKVHKAIFSGQNISKENLIKYVKNIKFQPASNIMNKNINKKYIEELEKTKYKETEKQALVKIRLGHSKLRDEVIKNKYKCEICGLSYNKLLVVSHIKPWSKSNDSEKLDFENILLLCSMHDALFDKGLISFDDNGKILISRELGEEEKALVNINEDSCIDINSQKQKDYLKYHRKNIFIK